MCLWGSEDGVRERARHHVAKGAGARFRARLLSHSEDFDIYLGDLSRAGTQSHL